MGFDELDNRILGFNTKERLDGDWCSLLEGIRNFDFEEYATEKWLGDGYCDNCSDEICVVRKSICGC